MEEKDILKAKTWYYDHVGHIHRLATFHDDTGYPPSEEDIKQPMLWKSAHWVWFMKKYIQE